MYKIRQFSGLTGVSTDTLRYYEKEGLLTPLRDGNGYRLYSEKDVAWLAFILRLKETRMPLAQIKTYARLRALGDSSLAERYAMLLAHQRYLSEWQEKLAVHQTHLQEKLQIYEAMLSKQQ
ncbi:MAG: MerR family transcriptional regulator [Cardiobacteriaceae bacterium]|nr:MerR family transcriptional regulator [Cardiobacteriaceae bacterium]